ncbi:MAG: PIN domain-containing protein [Candidatus Aenigmarchaeota archaeon]|nr:PIN domain-containing protein [Candidatus Aenigmarchaeota archaeon]
MPIPKKVYLDTNIVYGFFQNIIRGKMDHPEIIKFLAERKDVEKYISTFTVAEIVENLLKEFPYRSLKKDYIMSLVDTLRLTVDLKILQETIELSGELVDFVYECKDAKDSLHVLIAKKNDLFFITRDDKVGILKSLYPNIMGEQKFKKQFY